MTPRRSSLLFLGLLAAGCHNLGGSASLPTYSSMDAERARMILADRAGAIHTLTSQCQIVLERNNGQMVRLDGVIVMAPPDRIRLRAWKFGQAVFDLTLAPGGLWVEIPPDMQKRGGIIPATARAAEFARQLTWFTGGFFAPADLKVLAPAPDGDLVFSRDLPGGRTVICHVDPVTVVPRQFRLLDPSGFTRFTLDLTEYRDFNGIMWPAHLSASALAAPGESARHIDVSFDDVQFNAALADQAFVPPPSATRQP